MRRLAFSLGGAAAYLAVPATAAAHGDRVPVSQLGSAWEFSPAVLASGALALVLFAQAFVRLRRRGRRDLAGFGRAFCFLLGVSLAVLALVSPIDAIGEEYLLSVHMLQHVIIGDAAVALILLALCGPILFFLLPSPALGPLARARPLRASLGFVTRPTVSFAAWAFVIGVWHIPRFYDATLENQPLHDFEHVTFVLVGLLMWYQLLDPARRGRLTRSGRIGLAVAMFAVGQVLSTILLVSGTPLYRAYSLQDERLLGLSPLADQGAAGAVMMAEQAITLGALCAFLLLAADQELREEDGSGSLSAERRR